MRARTPAGSANSSAAAAASTTSGGRSAWPSARRITGIHCTAATSRSRCDARLRSVERGDERIAQLGHALLEPERHGGERAHAPPAPERVGGRREREDDCGGDREHAQGARRAEQPIDYSADRQQRGAGRDRPEHRARADRRRRACDARRRRARAPSCGRPLPAQERLEEQQRERGGEEPGREMTRWRGATLERARRDEWTRRRGAARGRSRRRERIARLRHRATRAPQRGGACSREARDRPRAQSGSRHRERSRAPSVRSVAAAVPSAQRAMMRPGGGIHACERRERRRQRPHLLRQRASAPACPRARACASQLESNRRRPAHERVRAIARPRRVTRRRRSAIDARDRSIGARSRRGQGTHAQRRRRSHRIVERCIRRPRCAPPPCPARRLRHAPGARVRATPRVSPLWPHPIPLRRAERPARSPPNPHRRATSSPRALRPRVRWRASRAARSCRCPPARLAASPCSRPYRVRALSNAMSTSPRASSRAALSAASAREPSARDASTITTRPTGPSAPRELRPRERHSHQHHRHYPHQHQQHVRQAHRARRRAHRHIGNESRRGQRRHARIPARENVQRDHRRAHRARRPQRPRREKGHAPRACTVAPATRSAEPRDPPPRPSAPRSTPRPPRATRARAPRATSRTPRDSPRASPSTSERLSSGCSGSMRDDRRARRIELLARDDVDREHVRARRDPLARGAQQRVVIAEKVRDQHDALRRPHERQRGRRSDALPAGTIVSSNRAASPITPRRVRGGELRPFPSRRERAHPPDRPRCARPPRARSRPGTPAPTSLACRGERPSTPMRRAAASCPASHDRS